MFKNKIVRKNISSKYIKKKIQKREPFSHKGDYGHALLALGSYGKIGAAIFAAKACLKCGVGKLTVHVPKCGYNILQSCVPEAMIVYNHNETTISKIKSIENYNTIGIGPGIGTKAKTEKILKHIILKYKKPMVIDADAINIISKNKNNLKNIPKNSIFTPHDIEFKRLIGKYESATIKHQLALEFCNNYTVYVISKSHETHIYCPNNKYYINKTGNAGMAKGGSGDVLTGMITAFLAQGYTAKNASIISVYLHGLAGDIAVKKTGEYSLLPSDIINNISKAFLTIL